MRQAMRVYGIGGFSLIEALVALALTASISAALLPSIAVASRLHRESAIETEAVIIGEARLEQLAADVVSGELQGGGSLDQCAAGWCVPVDRSGLVVDAARAAFEARWQVVALGAPARVSAVSVRVVPIASRGSAVTLAMAVSSE